MKTKFVTGDKVQICGSTHLTLSMIRELWPQAQIGIVYTITDYRVSPNGATSYAITPETREPLWWIEQLLSCADNLSPT